MPPSQINIRHDVLPHLATAIGFLGLGGGIQGVLNPHAFSQTIGLPILTPDSPALPFASFTGARNLGMGLSILVLRYTGQNRAIGTLLTTGVVTALIDAWICFQHEKAAGNAKPEEKKSSEGKDKLKENTKIGSKAVQHAFMGVFLGVLGYAML